MPAGFGPLASARHIRRFVFRRHLPDPFLAQVTFRFALDAAFPVAAMVHASVMAMFGQGFVLQVGNHLTLGNELISNL